MANKSSDIKNNPLVSIIMNCFNGEKHLEAAIDSIIRQTYNNWELIIWDNQSNDNTSKIANSYNDTRIKYFFAKCFTPLGEARNKAIKKSNGDVIGFLDCDDMYLPEKLDKQVPLFNNQDVGIVICDSIYFNTKGDTKQLYKKVKPPIGEVFKDLLANYFISLETAMIRRSALENLDYWFNTQFDVIEEYDLFVRIGYKWKLDFVDEVLAKWRVHRDSWTWSRSDLFPIETKIMLDNLSKTIPNLCERFPFEVNKVERSIAYSHAGNHWKKGNNKKARQSIKPFIYDDIKYKLLFLLMYFPYGIFNFIQNLRGIVLPSE